MACVGTNRSLMLDVQKKVGGSKPATLGTLSVGSANQRLMLRARGCWESLTAVEVPVVGPSLYTVCHSEALSVVVFTGTASILELSDPEEAAGENPNHTASPL